MPTLQENLHKLILDKLNENGEATDIFFASSLFYWQVGNKLKIYTPNYDTLKLDKKPYIAISLQPDNDPKPLKSMQAIDYFWTLQVAIPANQKDAVLNVLELFRLELNGDSGSVDGFRLHFKVFDTTQPQPVDVINYGEDMIFVSMQINIPATDKGLFGDDIVTTIDGIEVELMTSNIAVGRGLNLVQKNLENRAKTSSARAKNWNISISIIVDTSSDLYTKFRNEAEGIAPLNQTYIYKRTYPDTASFEKTVIIEQISSIETKGSFIAWPIVFQEKQV